MAAASDTSSNTSALAVAYKGEFVLHIALQNDSDIELSSPNQHSQMSYFRNSGLVEIIPDLLVNPEAIAQIVTGEDRLRLILAGAEGQIDITRGKSRSRNDLGIYTVRDVDFAPTTAVETMQGDEPAITNIQETLEDMVSTRPGLLRNEGAIGSVEIDGEKIIIDLEGWTVF